MTFEAHYEKTYKINQKIKSLGSFLTFFADFQDDDTEFIVGSTYAPSYTGVVSLVKRRIAPRYPFSEIVMTFRH